MNKVLGKYAVLGFALMMAVVFLSTGMSGSAEASSSGPISIGSDTDLQNFITTNGWPGNGTEDNPYVIYNLEIDATGHTNAIYLFDTHKHLVISNCILFNANQAGIAMQYVSNVSVQGNTINNNHVWAIMLDSSNNVTISGNDCAGNPDDGFQISSSSNVSVIGNIIVNSHNGMYLDEVQNSTFNGNILTIINNHGIYLGNSENNTFSDNSIDDSWYGIYLQFSHNNTINGSMCGYMASDVIYLYQSNNNQITNSTLSGTEEGAGIYVGYSSGNLISNNNIDDSTLFWTFYGVCLDVAHSNLVLNNTISGCWNGIELTNSNRNGLEDNTCTNPATAIRGTGIDLGDSNNNTIVNNKVNNSNAGIVLYDSNWNDVLDNTCEGLDGDGISVSNSNHNNIWNNRCANNSINGIAIYSLDASSYSNIIMNNTCNANDAGIYLDSSHLNTFYNNTCSGSNVGINLYRSNNNALTNNICNANNHNIYMMLANNNTVANNEVTNGLDGIYIIFSNNNTVSNNSCDGSYFGINVLDSSDNIISGNDCNYGNNYGIYIDNSSNNTITNNTCSNASSGIILLNSDNNTLAGNVVGAILKGISLESSNGNALIGNVCNGVVNEGGIMLSSFSNHNTISNNSCTGNLYGLYVGSSSFNMIDGNDFNDNIYQGITIVGESNNLILTRNNCNDNGLFGIQIGRADQYLIANNTCTGNAVHGIYLEYSPVNFTAMSNNTCSYNGEVGIYILYTTGIEISNNTCVGNQQYGISLGSSNGNILHGNLLIENNGATYEYDASHVQALDDGLNLWNGSSCGNYWSDWTSPDANGDGIVDDVYVIEGGSGVDNYPLAISLVITSPNEGVATDDPTISISGTAISHFGVAQVTWYNAATDESGVCTGTESWNATIALMEGANLITVSMLDLSGIVSNDTVTVVLDSTPPSLVITSPAEGAYVGSSPMVTWTASDAGTGVAYYTLSIEGLISITTSNTSYTFSDLAEGTYTVLVSAYDGLDNCQDVTVTFTVDTAAPTVTITSPADGLMSTTASITVVWTGNDTGSGITRYVVSWDGGSPVNLPSSTQSYTFIGLGDGSHLLKVAAFDLAGLSSSDQITVTVDTQAPSLTITSPADGGFIGTSDVIVVWEGSDAGTGIAYYTVSIEGLISINTTNTSYAFDDLANGAYTVLVSAYDGLGNYLDVTVTFTVDTVTPTVTITFPAESGYILQENVTIEWEATDVTGIALVEVSLDGVNWTVATGDNFTASDLLEGPMTAQVRVTDLAGNSASATVNFTVDTVAPTAETSPTGTGLGLNEVITVEFSEEMNQTSVSVAVIGLTGTLEWNESTVVFTPSALEYNRDYLVVVSGQDLAGNLMAVNWTFSTRSVGNITGVIVDENGEPMANATVTIEDVGVVSTDADGRYTFLNVSVGTYAVVVDKDGYDPLSFNVTVVQGATTDLGTTDLVPEGPGDEGDGDDAFWLYAIIAMLVLAVAGVGAFIFFRKK